MNPHQQIPVLQRGPHKGYGIQFLGVVNYPIIQIVHAGKGTMLWNIASQTPQAHTGNLLYQTFVPTHHHSTLGPLQLSQWPAIWHPTIWFLGHSSACIQSTVMHLLLKAEVLQALPEAPRSKEEISSVPQMKEVVIWITERTCGNTSSMYRT